MGVIPTVPILPGAAVNWLWVVPCRARLLNSLLGVKADEHVRYFIDREHRLGPGSVRLSATKKLLSKILLAGHQAANSLPSPSAA
jgi:hypothetical protein